MIVGASHGYAETVETLLKCSRVQIDMRSRYGQTALMKAAQAGKHNTFKILLDAGADYTIKNKQGKSAYDIAVEKGHVRLMDELKALSS